ncbi:glycosyltransferase [uncultured Bacteroides sp.]|uniref:glycosyltransferase n=1 Tax=uncultured Bacteroides sp. TaxID=162156 RepID=UPI0025F5EA9E|nr:glycosyltransferase [uncultured Bacteroides sp.]
MNIVIIANGYPTCREPQYGCFEKDQAIALQKEGHKVSILYVDGRFRKYYRRIGISHLQENDIDIYGLFLFPMALLFKMSYKLHYWVKKHMLDYVFSYMLKKQEKPDIIYAHFLYNIAYAVYLKEKYNIPLVGMEHWSVLNQFELSSDIIYRGQIAYQGANRIIAVSNSLKEQIYNHFKRDATVIHNMVNEEFFQMPIRKYTNRDKLIYISIGSLFYIKGHDILIKALSEVAQYTLDWELRIVGGGSEEKNLQNLIKQLGLENNIKLIGRKNKQEIISLLYDSDIFILPSRSENFSVAVLEALSAGLPVVATTCGGIRECINEKNGVLVSVEDVSGLAKSILDISKNIELYDKQFIADECKRCFSPSVISKEITDVFREVINEC